MPKSKGWTVKDAVNLYNIDRWSNGYFGVSEQGEVIIKAPLGDGDTATVSLMDVVHNLQQRGLDMPVLLRIENILEDRVHLLNNAFRKAIKSAGYKNEYRGVFPIKVNQQQHVVNQIARYGAEFNHGLEAGSKAELLVAMATLKNRDANIICNGYKDAEFIELGLYARKLGFNCFFVVETPSELDIILERSAALGIEPLLGVRVKLTTRVEGHWFEDSGDRSLFGLSAIQLIEAIDSLKQNNMLHCLQLLHCHIGSQIPNIRNIRAGVSEACRYYIDLVKEGAPLGRIDLGGGLAVDYTGCRTNQTHSMNYGLDEYCTDIVESVKEYMDDAGLDHPLILTESGRATVTHCCVLLFNILDVSSFEPTTVEFFKIDDDANEMVKNLVAVREALGAENIQECFNDTLYYRDELRAQFRRGQVSLRERSAGENVALDILQSILKLGGKALPKALEKLPEDLADIYYGNLSIFQSLPDSWAIEQPFPVLPIHRLNEQPNRAAIIADLTCDSDGKLDLFSESDGNFRKTLQLHGLNRDEPYYLGTFMVGAYQETLGDLHNLFGDTNVACVRLHEEGFDITQELEGDSISDVLSTVEFNPRDLYEEFRRSAEQAVKRGTISVAERQQMLRAFKNSLDGYTYFEHH